MRVCDVLNIHVTYCTVRGYTHFQVYSVNRQTPPPKEGSHCLPNRVSRNMAFSCTKSHH